MNNLKIGEPIKTSLSNSILMGVYGNDAILYSNSNNYEQYVYAHNIEYYEKENKYVWSSGDYYASLEECMIQVIANNKEVFYDLLDITQKSHYSTYLKGIIKNEIPNIDEEMLEDIYECASDMDIEYENILSEDFLLVKKEGIKNNILKNHKLWLESNGTEGKQLDTFNKSILFDEISCDSDFISNNLEKANFEDVYINESQFTNTKLSKANFEDSFIEMTKFNSVDLTEANFINTELENDVYFKDSLLIETTFENSKLYAARFTDSKFSDVHYNKTELTNTEFIDSEMYVVNFTSGSTKKTNIDNCKFRNVEFYNCNFKNVKIENTSFEDSYLEDVSFKDTIFENVSFENIKMENVDFTDSIILNPNIEDLEIEDYIKEHGGTVIRKISLLERVVPTIDKSKEHER